MFSVKVTFTMISSWQVHISTIFEQYFQQFFLATFLPPKPNPLRVIGAPLHGGLREKEGDSRCPLQLCIYLRVCLFVKKSAHLFLVFAPVTPLVSHPGMAIATR